MGREESQRRPDYKIEVFLRVANFLTFLILEISSPFIRVIQPEEIWLYRYPKVSEPFLYGFGGPLLTALLDPLSMVIYPLLAIFITWRFNKDTDELRRMYLIPTMSIPLTGTIINFLKIVVGRPRPNYMAMCYGSYYYLSYSDASRPCTVPESLGLEARKSFPSGHSGLAFASFGFLILYIYDKGRRIWLDERNRWMLFLIFVPLLLCPILVGVSRTCDYKHHWQDVLVGGLIGSLVTYVVYRLYAPSYNKLEFIRSDDLLLPLPVPTPLRKKDGRTHQARIQTSPGGVARNMTEALGKLNHNPIFLSAVGNDLFGRELMLQYDQKKIDKSKIHLSNSSSSAIYSTLLTKSGELMLGMGDMTIHDEISGDYILQHSTLIQSAPIVILDGNIPVHTLSTVLKLCNLSKTPVWFEPTEVRKAKKICKVNPDYLQAISYISPNIHELKSIVEEARGKDWNGLGSKKKIRFRDGAHSSSEETKWIVECFQIFNGLRMILLTKGKDGIVINFKTDCGHVDSVIHPAPELNPNDIKSVSGAGDCLNAGFISGILQGLSWISCARIGTQCASMSLKSFQNVPDAFKLRGHDSE